MTRIRTLVACAAGAATVALAASIAAPALATTSAGSTTATIGTVYQAKVVNQNIVLGPASNATLLTQTRKLPAGNYMVTATVGAVISSHDQIVCATFPSGTGNDGVFGTAGNPGTGGIYGTATMTDTMHVTAGQRIQVFCNSFNYPLGTYAASAVIEAVPVGVVS